jgi:heme oxygenase
LEQQGQREEEIHEGKIKPEGCKKQARDLSEHLVGKGSSRHLATSRNGTGCTWKKHLSCLNMTLDRKRKQSESK